IREREITLAAPSMVSRNREGSLQLLTAFLYDRDLFVGAGAETVEGDDRGLSQLAHALHVLFEVLEPGGDRRGVGLGQIFPGPPTVHLERPHRRHQDDRRRIESRGAAFDVEELLRSEITAKARLGDRPVREMKRGTGREDAVAAVGDVGEGAAVNEGGYTLEGLHQVGLQG